MATIIDNIGKLQNILLALDNYGKTTQIANFLAEDYTTFKDSQVIDIATGKFAFSPLDKIECINCETIGDRAFYENMDLNKINFPRCSHIGYYAFKGCDSLTSVSFPLCSYIEQGAFAQCAYLTQASFPICPYIGDYAFDNCSSLTAVSFPMCTSIGSYAFQSCPSLTSVSFPACSYIGNKAFAYCKSLASISLPQCSYIDARAFATCLNLTSVSFPICSHIGLWAFVTCSGLISADLGGDATISKCSIYPSAFASCIALTNLTLRYSFVATLGANAFSSTPMSLSTLTGSFGSIYVPASLVDAYKSATNWTAYADRITAIVDE